MFVSVVLIVFRSCSSYWVPERSPADIGSRFIKDAQIAGDSANLMAFFPLDDGVGDNVADLSFGGQAHGSIIGRSPDYYWVESDFEWRMLNVGGTGTEGTGLLSLAAGIGSNLVLLPNAQPCEVLRIMFSQTACNNRYRCCGDSPRPAKSCACPSSARSTSPSPTRSQARSSLFDHMIESIFSEYFIDPALIR